MKIVVLLRDPRTTDRTRRSADRRLLTCSGRRYAACALLALAAPLLCAQKERIQRWELRPAADAQRLYVTIDGVDRLISNRAINAWDGWTPQTIIYSEWVTQGSIDQQRLRWYDAFTRNSYTVSTDTLSYNDVVPARLSDGSYALLIGIRDRETKVPWVELATPNGGVFLREQFATYGTAANDFVEIRRYRPEDIERTKGELNLTTPFSTSRVSLRPGAVAGAAGIYEAALPAADAASRTVTLNLRPGGTATLVTSFEGKGMPISKQGSWSQNAAEVRVDFNGKLTVWTVGVNGLTPKSWDRKEWGAFGLALRRSLTAR
jgi:hypothetical protein